MKFIPKTEEELARESLLEAGTYPFEVLNASDEISKAGNEMIKIKVNVFGNNGEQVHVFDYLMEKMAFKLRHFAESAGLLADYNRGELSAISCVGRGGYVKVEIEAQAGYAPRNVVKDYVVKEQLAPSAIPARSTPSVPRNPRHTASMQAQAPIAAGDLDDDIPF